MKIIKLAAIFAVLVGAIFLALKWNSLFSRSTTTEFATEDKLNITDECNRIREAWEKESGWNEALYRKKMMIYVDKQFDVTLGKMFKED